MKTIIDSVILNKRISSLLKIIGSISLMVSVVVIIVLYIQNKDLKEQLTLQNSQLKMQLQNNQEEAVEPIEENLIKEREINYFVENILPQYPHLKSVSTDLILNIYTYTLKGLEDQSSGWLVETADNGSRSYYLVSSLVQKKLEDVMVPYVGESAVCTLTQVVTTGNEKRLNRNLSDKNGYIVIAGENCETYGGGNSVSIFSLSTGEKIKLTGNFNVRGTTWKGTTFSGTATGKLIGIFGVNNPQIVVSYGDDSWEGSVEEVRQIAFFDLQTGKLIRVQNFE